MKKARMVLMVLSLFLGVGLSGLGSSVLPPRHGGGAAGTVPGRVVPFGDDSGGSH